MQLLSQRDRRWAAHVLGWGPKVGTIGQFGCLLTAYAMVLWDAFKDMQYLPSALDEIFTGAKLFARDPTGTYDLLSDNTLDQRWPARFKSTHFAGFVASLIRLAVASPDTYVILWISTAKVPTHFVLAYSKDGSLIADPWTGQVGKLSGYGGPAAVHKTILVKKLLQAPAPIPAAPVPPSLYGLTLGGAMLASGLPLGEAIRRARAAAAVKPGVLFEIIDAGGRVVGTEFVVPDATPIPPGPVPVPTPPVAIDYSWQGLLVFLLNLLLKLSSPR